MDLFSLGIGIAVGAMFNPFWTMVWGKMKDWFASLKK